MWTRPRVRRRCDRVVVVVELLRSAHTMAATQQEQIDSIERRIHELMAEMDKLAEQGEIDAIDGMVDKVERLKVEKDDLMRAAGVPNQCTRVLLPSLRLVRDFNGVSNSEQGQSRV